ncbi:MAG: hypothetical protein E6R03_04020 [Hyphomicrobiaceae bacterium]|nr:MAG: hypothetical protein E6R03_04020 [Hyphomicrobiaceae bacterium]
MAITNADSLPGVNVDIADRKLTVQPIAPGPKLTILGTTTSLALDELVAVNITSVPVGIRLLRHTSGAPSELSLAVAEAVAAGAQNIEVMKLATLSGELGGATYSANDRFDDLEAAYDLLLETDVDVIVPVNAHLDATGLSGTSPEGDTRASIGFGRQLADFCYQATKRGNSAHGVIGVRSIMTTAKDEAWTGAPTSRTGEMFDDPTISHLKEWKAHLRSEDGTDVTHSSETFLDGYLAGSEEASYGTISPSYTFWARDSDGTTATDRNGVNVDGGGYISVTAMAVKATNDESQNLANVLGSPTQSRYNALSAGAVGYAALITRLDPHESTTNKTIPGYSPARRMSPSLAEEILQARMVTMMDRSGSFVISSGCTGAHNGSIYTRSDYVRLTTRRIVNAAVDIVRFQGDKFIGLPITDPNLNALESAISTALDKMRPTGALRSYTLSVSASPDDQVLGQATVEMTLVVGQELRTINTFVQLSKGEAIA